MPCRTASRRGTYRAPTPEGRVQLLGHAPELGSSAGRALGRSPRGHRLDFDRSNHHGPAAQLEEVASDTGQCRFESCRDHIVTADEAEAVEAGRWAGGCEFLRSPWPTWPRPDRGTRGASPRHLVDYRGAPQTSRRSGADNPRLNARSFYPPRLGPPDDHPCLASGSPAASESASRSVSGAACALSARGRRPSRARVRGRTGDPVCKRRRRAEAGSAPLRDVPSGRRARSASRPRARWPPRGPSRRP